MLTTKSYQPSSTTSSPNRVITYVPQNEQDNSSEQQAGDMGFIRRGVYLYTNKLGMEFTLVLLFSLGYQAIVAVALGIRAIYYLPLVSWLPGDGGWAIMRYTGAIVIGSFIQGLMIAEAAQVVWLRRTDRLKIRLLSNSSWWWLGLIVLGLVILLDFLLWFLALTGTSDLGRAWKAAFADHATLLADVLLTILNFLTLLRCAAVMRTSTGEENRREVKEHMEAIAGEILLEAGDATQLQAQKVWKTLNADPRRFLPLQESVMELIRQQYPQLFPGGLGGDTWAYDLNGNTFTALSPDLHLSLLQGRGHRERFSDDNQRHLWGMAPEDLAELIAYNFATQGKPRFIDMTNPEEPEYAYSPANFAALAGPDTSRKLNTQATVAAGSSSSSAGGPVSGAGAPDPASTVFADRASFVAALSNVEKIRFATHLKSQAFPQLHGGEWTEGAGVDVWNVFDLVELQYLYRQWSHKN